MKKKLWGGRFKKANHPLFEKFSSSISYDYHLLPYDLMASMAHCEMLGRIGLLRASSVRQIIGALKKLQKKAPEFMAKLPNSSYEDVHSFIELELVRLIGSDAKRIHAGRSRNDQVNQATRMYCKDKGQQILVRIRSIQKALLRLAQKHKTLAVSGMTHMQKAQPVLVAHMFLAYIDMLDRSGGRLKDALGRLDVLTLGSGALAGSSLPLDREYVRKKLGFARLSGNSYDAVGSRDFVSEFVHALCLLVVDLSRISEDLMLGQLNSFCIFDIPEELCTGSSMMPQKKNADFVELSRGLAALLEGHVVSLISLQKGLPTSYNRDLQWDKKALVESVELILPNLYLWEHLFSHLQISAQKCEASLQDDTLLATDLAELLTRNGMPFREAHERVGQFVAFAEDRELRFKDVSLVDIERLLGKGASKLVKQLNVSYSLRAKTIPGSTGYAPVEQQLRIWEKKLHASF